MEKVKLHFSIEQTIEQLDDAFFDRAVECITAMHRLWQRGIEPENRFRLGRGFHTPGSQHHGGKRSVSSLRQRVYRTLRSLTNIPNTVFHIDPHP